MQRPYVSLGPAKIANRTVLSLALCPCRRQICLTAEANQQGHLWSEELNLFLGIYNQTLRYYDTEGQLVPTPEEAAQ